MFAQFEATDCIGEKPADQIRCEDALVAEYSPEVFDLSPSRESADRTGPRLHV